MPELPRLNNVIRLLEEGRVPITTFSPPSADSAVALSAAAYDFASRQAASAGYAD